MQYKETRVWKGLRFAILTIVNSYFYGKKWMLISSLHFSPKNTYFFSHLKRLPFPHQLIEKTDNPLDDFTFKEDIESSNLVSSEHINVVMRGTSFDQNKLEMLEGLTFLVNWPEKVENSNVIYATADQNDLKAMIEKRMAPLFFVHGTYYENGKCYGDSLKPGIKDHILNGTVKRVFFNHKAEGFAPPISSGLAAIVALTKYTKQMNIYGFDQYLTKDLGGMSHWKALFALQSFSFGGPQLAFLPSSLPPVNDIPERAIYSWHYTHRFQEISWIHIEGFLANISKHKKIVNHLDKIFYQ